MGGEETKRIRFKSRGQNGKEAETTKKPAENASDAKRLDDKLVIYRPAVFIAAPI